MVEHALSSLLIRALLMTSNSTSTRQSDHQPSSHSASAAKQTKNELQDDPTPQSTDSYTTPYGITITKQTMVSSSFRAGVEDTDRTIGYEPSANAYRATIWAGEYVEEKKESQVTKTAEGGSSSCSSRAARKVMRRLRSYDRDSDRRTEKGGER